MRNWLARLFGSQAEDPAAEYQRQSGQILSASRGKAAAPTELFNPEKLRQWRNDSGVALSEIDSELLYWTIRDKRKLEAIVCLREGASPRMGLKEAKHMVEKAESLVR
jgi:hypothetical protein